MPRRRATNAATAPLYDAKTTTAPCLPASLQPTQFADLRVLAAR
jgi:hypothetical protein